MSTQSALPPDFESALKELEEIVRTMEQGDLSLDKSLAVFERGIQLSRFCQQALATAKQKVEKLVSAEESDPPVFEPFGDEAADDA